MRKKYSDAYKNHFRVAVFGSARIKRDDRIYRQVYGLAKLIAAAGFDVVTGGGPGLMEAANKGHQHGRRNPVVPGAHPAGPPCLPVVPRQIRLRRPGRGTSPTVVSYGLNIKLPWEQEANRHLDIKKDFARFSSRLDTFMELSHVAVVAPGGVGTLLELFYTWQLVQVNHIAPIPIILLGDMWDELYAWLKKWALRRRLISREDLALIRLAATNTEAMQWIDRHHRESRRNLPGK